MGVLLLSHELGLGGCLRQESGRLGVLLQASISSSAKWWSGPLGDSPDALVCSMLHFLWQREFSENLQVIKWIYTTYIFMCISVSPYKPVVVYLRPMHTNRLMPVSSNKSFSHCGKQVLDPSNPRMSTWGWVAFSPEYSLGKTFPPWEPTASCSHPSPPLLVHSAFILIVCVVKIIMIRIFQGSRYRY